MPLSTNDLAAVRAQIGTNTPPTDSELNAAYDRLGSVPAVIIEELTARKAALLENPASINIPGIYAENNAPIIEALERQIAREEAGGRQVTAARLVRPNRSRHPRPDWQQAGPNVLY